MNIFPTPIKIVNLESFNSDLISAIQNIEYRGNNTHGYMSVDQQILNKKEFVSVYNEILSHINDYVLELNHYAENITIVSSWANRLSSNQTIHPHVHSNSYISGVLYFGNGSSLILRPPTIDTLFTISTEFKNTPEVVTIEPKAGQVVLLPSKIIHNVEPAKSERYSIAFNTWPRKYGYPTAEVNL